MDSALSDLPNFNPSAYLSTVSTDHTLITFAIFRKRRDIVRLLIEEYGISVDVKTSSSRHADPESPVVAAMRGYDIEMMKYLIEVVGIDVNEDCREIGLGYQSHVYYVEDDGFGFSVDPDNGPKYLQNTLWVKGQLSLDGETRALTRYINMYRYLLCYTGAYSVNVGRMLSSRSDLMLSENIVKCFIESPSPFSPYEIFRIFNENIDSCDLAIHYLDVRHFRYMFETCDLISHMHDLEYALVHRSEPTPGSITCSSNSFPTLTRSLFSFQTNLDNIKYFIEKLQLNPLNIEKSEEHSVLYEQESFINIQYLIKHTGVPISQKLVMHYMTHTRYQLSDFELRQLLQFVHREVPTLLQSIVNEDTQENILQICCCRQVTSTYVIQWLIEELKYDPFILNKEGKNLMMLINWQNDIMHNNISPLYAYLVNTIRMDINAQDGAGKTVVMHVALSRLICDRVPQRKFDEFQIKTLQHLESLGANFSIADRDGNTVYTLNKTLMARYKSVFSEEIIEEQVADREMNHGSKRKRDSSW